MSESLEQLNERLTEAESRLSMALVIGEVGIWDLNMVTGTLNWDNRMHRLFRTNPMDWKGTTDAFLEEVHPSDREKVRLALEASAQQDTPYDLSYKIVKAPYTIRARGRVLRDADGKPVRMLGVCIKDPALCHTCRWNPEREGCGHLNAPDPLPDTSHA